MEEVCPVAMGEGQERRKEGRGIIKTSGRILIWQSIILKQKKI